MGSPLGPVLADIFMGHIEQILQDKIKALSYYARYVDDTFAICTSEDQANSLLQHLNTVHNNLKFTMEKEQDQSISFLDVCVTRRNDGTIRRSIHRKTTWTGQYLHFTSFTPIQHKRALVASLFHRARQICSDDTINYELSFLKETLKSNAYPENFITRYSSVRTKITSFDVPKKRNIC